MTTPTLFLLHALGGSARAWDEVVARLRPRFECVALDLPGYGERAAEGYADVAATIDGVAAAVRARAPAAWLVVGHSMGGKVATLLAAQAEAGAAGLSGLAGVVLLAASPPAPEPMAEERRARMIGWFADGPASEADARAFVEVNVAGPLPAPLMARAVADVRRSDPQAWTGWLERGSREDWRAEAGRIATPAVIVAGAEDGDLGEDAQRRLNLPHYAQARLEVVPGAAHLLPSERPDAVAALIAAQGDAARALPDRFARLLASDRVSARTRAAMLARHAGPGADAPSVLTAAQRATLAALVEVVLPRAADGHDLARRIDADLAAGTGDGWRFAELPSDAACWAAGLDTLDALGGGFGDRDLDARARLLEAVAAGEAAPGALSPAQLRLWFEDARAEIVRHWVSLPATMARIGYDGFANGGDGPRKQGYLRTGADEVEPWQLRPEAAE